MKKILIILSLFLFMCSCSEERSFEIDSSRINKIDYSDSDELNFLIHSRGYLLIDLSNYRALKANKIYNRMYPASLTKVLTLNTVLYLEEDLSKTSSITSKQINDLIKEDASLAHLESDKEYTLEELLFALILPSGADAAIALENYFVEKNIDLIEQMNIRAKEIGCKSSYFVNTTGLHDPMHYSTLYDLSLIVLDTLKYAKGREVLESFEHELDDKNIVESTLKPLMELEFANVLGGKTGYTPEAGQNIMVLYRQHNRSYLLLLCNADGSASRHEYFHYEDALNIISYFNN